MSGATTTPAQRKSKTNPRWLQDYRALCAEAKRLGMPEAYESDLHVHDREWLQRQNRPEKFVWILRPYGTHLYPPLAYGDSACLEMCSTIRYHANPTFYQGGKRTRLFYWFDGTKLREVTPERACELFKAENNRLRNEGATFDCGWIGP